MTLNFGVIGNLSLQAVEIAVMHPDLSESVSGLLQTALRKSVSVKAVLYAIAVPLLMLVVIFIGMIAVRIIDSEQGEIAMLHSRGVTRGKIILIYTVQSLIIAAAAFLPGIFLGYLIGKITASVNGFLTFEGSIARGYNMNPEMLLVSVAAAFVCAIIMLLPVVPRSKNTVVENKSKRHLSGTPLWERYFIDVILLGISIYLLYGYLKQQDVIRMSVLAGDGIDPMIFLDSTLFLISCGLLRFHSASPRNNCNKNSHSWFSPPKWSAIHPAILIFTVKVLPLPGALFTSISPPTISTTRLTRARPRPLPCVA